jgi:hypothetical protein
MDWIDLAHDIDKWRALMKAVMNLRKFLSGCTTSGVTSSAQLHRVI